MLARALLAIFFLSGAVSLVYEAIWARLLALTLGNTTAAHTVVIATFMGGLALGYAWFGRRADALPRPLRTYALLEVGITAWAAAFPLLLEATHAALPASTLGHVLSAVVLLLVPTFLMGGTLPVLVRALAPTGGAGPAVARLYAVNSAGAVTGVLWAGLFGIELLGLRGSLWTAAAVNACLAATAFTLSRRHHAPPPAAPPTPTPEPSLATGHVPLSWIVAAAGVAGFTSLALQGLWLRYFGMTFGSSSYSFTVVVAAFIAGITLGSATVGRLMARGLRDTPLALALALLGSAAALVLTGPLYDRLPFELARMRIDLMPDGFTRYVLQQLGLAFGFLIVPTFLFGLLLPLASRAAADRYGAAAGTGRVFAVNTVAAVAGAALALPVLVPALGLEGLYRLATALLALTGLALLARRALTARPTWWIALVAGVLTLLSATAAGPGWDRHVLTAGAFRLRELPGDLAFWREHLHRSDIVFHRDGAHATVAVLERGGHRVLSVNGKPDASTRGDMLTQVASAHVPMALAAGLRGVPDDVLVIGVGSGVTVGSALTWGAEVTVVEISQAVVDAARTFGHVNGGWLDSGTAELVVDDARSFLARTERRWDVIVSEPSNPWVAGNAGLFSVEFFELLRDHLEPGGVLAQWVQLYETDDTNLRMVVRTLRRVFPHVTGWELFPNDLLLVASTAPIAPDLQRVEAALERPAVAADLRRVHVHGVAGVMSLQVLGPPEVDELLAEPGPLNTDDRPLLEFLAPRRLFEGRPAEVIGELDVREHLAVDPAHRDGSRRLLRAGPGITPEIAEQLFVQHSLYPAAPMVFRDRLVRAWHSRWEPEFLIDVGFTLEHEPTSGVTDLVVADLVGRAPDLPAALHVAARLRIAALDRDGAAPDDPRWKEVLDLVDRCIRRGDEPRGRCRPLRTRLFERLGR